MLTIFLGYGIFKSIQSRLVGIEEGAGEDFYKRQIWLKGCHGNRQKRRE